MGFCLAYLLFTGDEGGRILLTVLAIAAGALPWGKWFRPRPRWPRYYRAARRGERLRRLKPILPMLIVGVVSFAATAGLALKRGIPLPYVHDEFSYLLAADTFARGRLTNPTPPLWEHFESMHILVRPTYMSKYQPAQGLFMALGQVLTGQPIWGVWISTALACMAIAWMLRAFVPARWALLGGLMAAIHPQILEWGQRYWGGNVAVMGGALALGGFARLVWNHGRSRILLEELKFALPAYMAYRSAAWEGSSWASERLAGGGGWAAQGAREVPIRVSDALWMALGIAILALSRPFEGLILTLLLGVGLVIWMVRSTPRRLVRRLVLPMLAVFLPAGAWMGYYNWRVTGHALRMPYQEHHAQYAVVPLFIFQEKTPQPVYRHKEMEIFQIREQEYWYRRRSSWYELRKEALKNIDRLTSGWLGNVEVLAVPLFILPWVVWKNRQARFLAMALVLFAAALMLETYMSAHYASPAAAVVVALVVIALRHLARLGHPLGALLMRLTVILFVVWALVWWKGFYNWKQEGFPVWRHQVTENLLSAPGKHLVIVRYGDHNVHEEWVYNEADLEGAKVVWAREMDPQRNVRLLEYFKDRKVWLIEPDVDPTRIRTYEPKPTARPEHPAG